MFTEEEITILKELIAERKAFKANELLIAKSVREDAKISKELAKINAKYQDKLNKAAADGKIEKRRQLIEQMTAEAKAKENEMLAELSTRQN